MAGCHDQLLYPLDRFLAYLSGGQFFRCPVSAACFIVLSFDVIHCIMKPKRNLYFCRIFVKVTVWLKQGETFIEMLERVILPLWLFVRGNSFIKVMPSPEA